jgi:hypothetical protein
VRADQVSAGSSLAPKQTVVKFLAGLEQHAQREFIYIAPNYVVGFRARGQAIAIGSVEAILTDDLLPELLKNKKNPRWTITRTQKLGFKWDPSGIEFQLPPVVWRVRVKAAKGFVDEEGLWLINVAISFLRLSYPAGRFDFFPSVGDQEAPAIEEARTTDSGFTFTEDAISGGSHKTPYVYVVDDSILTISRSVQFQERARLVFAPPKASVAERFGAGLGWLTRGRQSADRAERFLYFFTAIEALLSSSDATAPVVQTISRYAATVLQPNIKERILLAKQLVSLYATRSALVHTGKRNVLQAAVDQLQDIAEHVYKTVMEGTDLSQTFEAFHKALGEASYGLPWPP